MTFYERLVKARRDLGLSQKEVSEYFIKKGFPVQPYTVSRWESQGQKLSIEEFAVLCECYRVQDIKLFLTGKPSFSGSDTLLSGLNSMGREHVKNYINLLKDDSTFTKVDNIIPFRSFRLYDLPVSAGLGSFLDGDDFEEVTFNELTPENTDFAVRVSGDSMEPKIHDGQVLYIKEQQVLEVGEIGIFYLNGDAYVKKLGKGALVSFNPKYEPIPIYESDETRIFGKVIGIH